MSGKASRKVRKQRRISNKLIAAGLSFAVLSMPVYSNGEVLVSIYPHFTAPITAGNDHDIQYGVGGGAKITYRPLSFLDFSLKGDYMNLSLPNVEGISVLNGAVEAGYHVNLSDRTALNFSCDVGAYKASQNDTTSGFTAGATVSFSYRINPVVSSDLHGGIRHYAAGNAALLTGATFSPGLTFNITRAFKNYSKIRLGEQQLKPVFPVLYSWYDNNSFGSVEVINEEDSKIQNLQVSFYQPQYMGQANVCGKLDELEKGGKFKCDLTAFFNERMLDLTEKTDTQAIVSVDYTVLGQKRHKEFTMVVPVYGRNSMSWDDDRSASVFVSSKDPAALWFSKYITSIVRDNTRSGVPLNIQYAMGIFDTLDQFGLNYVIDPSSAYSDNVGTSSIDFLQFPYQTLMYRGGDCDDISILVCSLFEAVGIPTAFITIPGHIYMAFDSGLKLDEAKKQFNSLSNYIVKNDEVWVPLEITLTDEGFNKAWRVGAREWNAADKNGTAAFYRIHDSWKIYKPVSVPGATVNFTMPEKEIVSKLFTHSIDEWIVREITPQIDLYNTMLAKNRTYEIQNSLGVLYGRYGLVMQADDQFKKGRRAGYVPSILNTANLYYSMQDFKTAKKWYKEVLKKDKNNVLALLGIARCDYELEEYEECDAYYVKVMNIDSDLAGEYAYLGAFENTRGRSFNLADRITYTVWSDDAGDKLMAERAREEEEKPFEDIGVAFAMEALVPDAEVRGEMGNEDFLEPDAVGGDGDGSDSDEELSILDEDAVEEDEYIGLQNQIALLVPDEIFVDINVSEVAGVAALASDVLVGNVNNGAPAGSVETAEIAEAVEEVPVEAVEIAEETSEIAEAVEEVPVEAVEIAEETAEIAEAAEEVPVEAVGVAEETSEIAEAVEEVPVEAVEIAEETSEIAETVEEVPVEAVEVAEETSEIAEAVEEVPVEAVEIAEETAEIAETVEEVPVEAVEVAEETAEIAEAAEEVPVEAVEIAEETSEIAEAVAIVDVSELLSEVVSEEVSVSAELSEMEDLLASLKENTAAEPEIQFYTEEPEFPVPSLAEIEEEPEEMEEEIAEVTDVTEEISDESSVPEIESSDIEIAELTQETYEEEEEEEEIDTSVVPRFSVQPSAEWAPESAYTAETIPGMKSYELEMGNRENEKAFLYEERLSISVDPEKDFEVEIKTDEKKEVAMLQADVNPFSSFLSEEDAKVVEQITNYSLPEKNEEPEIESDSVVQSDTDIGSDAVVESEIKAEKPNNKKIYGGLLAAAMILSGAAGASIAAKKSHKKSKKDGK